jgi:hypothetical protein
MPALARGHVRSGLAWMRGTACERGRVHGSVFVWVGGGGRVHGSGPAARNPRVASGSRNSNNWTDPWTVRYRVDR